MNDFENHSLAHPDNLYIVGAWLSYERALQGYSLRGLARGSNVAASLISAIENQKTKANLETLKYLYEALHHPFITDEDYLKSVQENIQSLYYAVYDQNDAVIPHLYAGLKEHFTKLKYSPITVDLILIEAFMQIHYEDGPVSKAFEALIHHETFLSTPQKQRLYLNLGYLALKGGDVTGAIQAFEKVLVNHRESRAHAVALTMIAQLKLRDFDILGALERANEASKLHAYYSNLFRKVEVDFTLIQCHITLNQLQHAESILQNLSYVLVQSNARYWNELQAFKAYVAYRKGAFHESIQILHKIEERNLLQTILLAQSQVHTSKLDAAKSLYDALLNDPDLSPTQRTMIQILMLQFPGSDIKTVNVESLFDDPKQFEHLHVVQTLMDVLNEYAHTHQETEVLYRLQKLSLKLMKYE